MLTPFAFLQNIGLPELLILGMLVLIPVIILSIVVMRIHSHGFHAPDFPLIVRQALDEMPENDRRVFFDEFERRKRTTGLAYLLWFLGFHYAYFKSWTMFAAFILSCFFCIGIIWWIVDLFRISSMLQVYNQDLAIAILKDMKFLRTGGT